MASPEECWEWLRARHEFGYGIFRVAGRKEYAHRYSYVLSYGTVPAGLCVMHKCDNPKCVNPRHLAIGTKADNSLDMVKKLRGSGQKLTPDQVLAIRSLDLTLREIGEIFGLSETSVSNIKRRKTWTFI